MRAAPTTIVRFLDALRRRLSVTFKVTVSVSARLSVSVDLDVRPSVTALLRPLWPVQTNLHGLAEHLEARPSRTSLPPTIGLAGVTVNAAVGFPAAATAVPVEPLTIAAKATTAVSETLAVRGIRIQSPQFGLAAKSLYAHLAARPAGASRCGLPDPNQVSEAPT